MKQEEAGLGQRENREGQGSEWAGEGEELAAGAACGGLGLEGWAQAGSKDSRIATSAARWRVTLSRRRCQGVEPQ